MITVEFLRKKYPELSKNYTDEQIQDLIDIYDPIAYLQVESYFDRFKYTNAPISNN